MDLFELSYIRRKLPQVVIVSAYDEFHGYIRVIQQAMCENVEKLLRILIVCSLAFSNLESLVYDSKTVGII